MNKIQQIEAAIAAAEQEQSALSPEVLGLEGMNSAKVRHLLNNLGAISTKHFEIGSWHGSSFCSTMFRNDTLQGVAVDNFSEFDQDGIAQKAFLSNAKALIPEDRWELIVDECFRMKSLDFPPTGLFVPDLYVYDGGHSEENQRMAVAHFFPMMADSFVFVVDDFGSEGSDWGHVQKATREGLELVKSEYEVLKEWVLTAEAGYWNGLGIFLIKRK